MRIDKKDNKEYYKYKVLFVDDELNLLNSIKRGLIGYKFKCLYTDSAKKALEVLKEDLEIGVVISDLRMPEMNGIDFLKLVNNVYPEIIKIVLTGNSQVSNIIATVNNSNIYKYLVKPWRLEEELIPTIDEALHAYHLNMEKIKMTDENEVLAALEEEQIKYFERILELIRQSDEELVTIHKISKQLPFLNKEVLGKLSLDVYTRSGNVSSNLNSICKVIEKIIKASKDKID